MELTRSEAELIWLERVTSLIDTCIPAVAMLITEAAMPTASIVVFEVIANDGRNHHGGRGARSIKIQTTTPI